MIDVQNVGGEQDMECITRAKIDWCMNWCYNNNCSPYKTQNWNKALFQYKKYKEELLKEEQVKEVIEIDGVKYKRVEEDKPRGLYLEVDIYDYLLIKYKNEEVGFIKNEGECTILSHEAYIKTYEQWREDGMIIDETPVQWRGGTYRIINSYYLTRTDILCGEIYRFDSCRASVDCKDENIIRFKHNNRPVLF